MKLILANLRVSVSIASNTCTGATIWTLIKEERRPACRRLRNSIRRKRALFAYAAWWSRAYILRYLLNTYRLIKVGTTQDQRKLFTT